MKIKNQTGMSVLIFTQHFFENPDNIIMININIVRNKMVSRAGEMTLYLKSPKYSILKTQYNSEDFVR